MEYHKENENYKFNLTIKNYKKLMPIFRKTKLIPKIEETWTALFINRYKKEGLFLGLIIYNIGIYYVLVYWDIEVLGVKIHSELY